MRCDEGRICLWLTLGTFAFIRSPLVSFLYERGWRQNFNRSGFPGPDEEVKLSWFCNRDRNFGDAYKHVFCFFVFVK